MTTHAETLFDRWRGILEAEGYRPQEPRGAYLPFKREGLTFAVAVEENDPSYASVLLPNCWDIESHEERLRALEAANTVTRDMKVVKAFLTESNVSFSVELWLPSLDAAGPMLDRLMSALVSARSRFADEMKAKPIEPLASTWMTASGPRRQN